MVSAATRIAATQNTYREKRVMTQNTENETFAPVTDTVETAAAVEPAAPVQEEIASAADQAIDAVTAQQQEAIEAAQAAGVTMIENVTLAQRALAEFVSTRIREDIEAQQQFLRCKSLEDVRSLQSKFFKTAMEQYSDNAQRMFKLGQEIVTRSTQRAH